MKTFGAKIWLLTAAVAVIVACGGDAPPAPTSDALFPGPTATPAPQLGTISAAPTGVAATPAVETAPCHESGYCAAFAVGGRLLAAAWLDDRRMYLADMGGRIRLLDVATGDIDTMLDGLAMPRGLTVLDGRLYVSDMGNSCELIQEMFGDKQWERCNLRNIGIGTDSYMEFFSRVSAQILSYGIDDSGALGDRQVVADSIIAYDLGRGINGLINDGEYVYVSIGHPQNNANPQGYFVTDADKLASHGRRTDLMGAIARFRPPYQDVEAEVEVYAAGFRNVYGISIAPDGTIYAADNDDDIKHLEELNAVVEGGFYGYPLYGTNEAPPEANVIEPVAVLKGLASTYAYANEHGVYVAYVATMTPKPGFAVDRFDYDSWTSQRIFTIDHHITALLERQGLLYATSLSGNVYVINPFTAPASIGQTAPFYNDRYADEVIAKGAPSVTGPGYDVYIDDKRLLYHKSPCAPADTDQAFHLHLFPLNPEDLPEDRKQHGFNNLDFSFAAMGWRTGNICRAVRILPEYPIARIRTGQSIPLEAGFRNTWQAEYDFRR